MILSIKATVFLKIGYLRKNLFFVVAYLSVLCYNISEICRSGETGRHAALRWLWEKSRGGSSPFFGTIFLGVIEALFFYDTRRLSHGYVFTADFRFKFWFLDCVGSGGSLFFISADGAVKAWH